MRYFQKKHLLLLLISIFLGGCADNETNNRDDVFKILYPSKTGVGFQNNLESSYSFNIYRYRNFYNGGGVSIGDINNDGFQDVFLTGNQVSNKLYINDGNFRFSRITDKANVSGQGAWSTGVSMADINGDGFLDIYVCNSGIVEGDDRKNELYINNGDSTFTEKAEEYGLADAGFSISAQFFDYDKDGDLDLYLVNNSYKEIGSFDPRESSRKSSHKLGGDRLYRNNLSDVNSKSYISFTDVTKEANIYSSEIGFGLGASVADINRDEWPDIYVSNDFFERDYLYINDKDGTFREVVKQSTESISAASMGSDISDINYDGYPDIFVTEMLPRVENRIKKVTSFDNWDRYSRFTNYGYHYQFTRNTLQLNRTPYAPFEGVDAKTNVPAVHFSEVGRLAGVEATDWSWGALIADYDLDGFRDIFVSNGIYRDLTNADFITEIRSKETMNRIVSGDSVDFSRLIQMIPSNPISNYMFAGEAGLRFTEISQEWGLAQPSFSNGAAYGDLDNDGDLDLVVNNVNMEAFIYRNQTRELHPDRAWLQVDLEGKPPNTFAVGAQVTAWSNGQQWYVEQQPVRGFQSTVGPVLHFGFGTGVSSERLDSLVVRWPDGSKSLQNDVSVNQRLTVSHPHNNLEPGNASPSKRATASQMSEAAQRDFSLHTKERKNNENLQYKRVSSSSLNIDWKHQENKHNDFTRQPLLFHMRSTEGPPVCTGDINDDGIEDIFVGGSAIQSGSVFIQRRDERFTRIEQPALVEDRRSEDTDCALFDADGDGTLDLYVASGGSEYPASSTDLMDRLYVNDGDGRLVRSSQTLIRASEGFEPTGVVAPADYDGDGDVDLFVGGRMRPFAFGVPADGHLLINDGTGSFMERTDALAPELQDLGMITDAEWADVGGDGNLDLMVAGEWMPLTFFENQEGRLVDRSAEKGLDATSGWWNAVELTDLDGDGDLDLIGANHGLNSRFGATPEKPLRMWVHDFDRDGSAEQVIAIHREGQLYPVALRHDLLDAIPTLKEKYPTYESYAGETVYQIFSEKELSSATSHKVQMLESVVGWNKHGRGFTLQSLPQRAQLSPMYDIQVANLDSSETPDIIMGGNLYEAKPQVGRYDASYGVAMNADSTRIKPVPASRSGFWVEGQVRDLETLGQGQNRLLVVGINDDSLSVFKY